MPDYERLPFVDEHAIDVEAPPPRVWEALRRTAPSTGFHVTESVAPRRLVLEGRHPFSKYALVFLIDAREGGGSRARAQTWAAFPGPQGRIYRALVIGSGMHAVMVRRMIRRLR